MTMPDSSALGGAARAVSGYRPAAAVLLLRRAPRLQVCWIERHPLLAYLGGFHAFPGGRVGPEDGTVPVAGAGDPAEARRHAAAARELLEETGVLLVRPAAADRAVLPGPDERTAARGGGWRS
jgi:8-oxo-dGTP pyrophosphatase MutT (NUDIX family)